MFGRVSNTDRDFKLLSTYSTDWKIGGSERSSLQSAEISGNDGEDEDMDTYLSDPDKQTESSCQIDEKRGESCSTIAIYAVPCKNKKVGVSNVFVPLWYFSKLMQILNIFKALHSPQAFFQHLLLSVIHLLPYDLGWFVDPHRYHIFSW